MILLSSSHCPPGTPINLSRSLYSLPLLLIPLKPSYLVMSSFSSHSFRLLSPHSFCVPLSRSSLLCLFFFILSIPGTVCWSCSLYYYFSSMASNPQDAFVFILSHIYYQSKSFKHTWSSHVFRLYIWFLNPSLYIYDICLLIWMYMDILRKNMSTLKHASSLLYYNI